MSVMPNLEEISEIYQTLIGKEYKKISSENPDLSSDKTFLSKEEIEGICEGDISLETLENKKLIHKYEEDKYRTSHFDLMYRLIKIRNLEHQPPLSLEHVIKRTTELVPDFGQHDLEEILSDLLGTVFEGEMIERIAEAFKVTENITGLSSHQKPIVEKLIKKSKQNVGIAAPTAAGKTLAFFLPILVAALKKRLEGEKGISSLLVYPRKALARDQFSNFLKEIDYLNEYLSDLDAKPITIGIEDRDSKKFEKGEKYRGIKCISDGCEGKLVVSEGGGREIVNCPVCGKSYPYIAPSYEAISRRKPTILLTNIWIIYRRLLRPDAVSKYKELDYLVLDEAHVYTHFLGGHVTYLLKMLRHVASQRGSAPISIFSSATLPNPKEFICDLADIDERELLFIPYQETLEESEGFTPQRTLLRLYLLPNPQRKVETLNQALILAIALWCHKNDMKAINFIDSIAEINKIRSYLKETILSETARRGREVTDHVFDTENVLENDYAWGSLTPDEFIGDVNDLRDFALGKFKKSIKIHYGGMSKERRARIEDDFEKGINRLILSTSTLELGIDLADVAVILQYKLPPFSKEGIIQRVGRSGRDPECQRVGLGVIALSSSPISTMYMYDSDLRKKLEDVAHLPPSQVGKTGSIQLQHVLSLVLYKRAMEGKTTFMKNNRISSGKQALNALKEIRSELKGIKDFNKEVGLLEEEELDEYREELIKLLDDILEGGESEVEEEDLALPENIETKIEDNLIKSQKARNRIESVYQKLASLDSLPSDKKKSISSIISPLEKLVLLLQDLEEMSKFAWKRRNSQVVRTWRKEKGSALEEAIKSLPSYDKMTHIYPKLITWVNDEYGGFSELRKKEGVDFNKVVGELSEVINSLDSEKESLKSSLKGLLSDLECYEDMDFDSLSTRRAIKNLRKRIEESEFPSLDIFQTLNAMLKGKARFSTLLSPPQPDFEMEMEV